MESVLSLKKLLKGKKNKTIDNLSDARLGKTYMIREIVANQEMKNFLFTLGCYAGETITLISILSENYVINIKDARYSIDKDLAKAIKLVI